MYVRNYTLVDQKSEHRVQNIIVYIYNVGRVEGISFRFPTSQKCT
jgi:hypothetical protein